jgi:hypothetical protein
MNMREFLTSPVAYLAPDRILEGLNAGDAERRVTGASHSVAELVAHVAFWQDWFYGRCQGRPLPMVSSAAAGWPSVPDGSWPAVRSRFVDGLQQLAALSEGDTSRPLTPPIEFPAARSLHHR